MSATPFPDAPDVAAPSGGLLHAIWSLITPPHFTPLVPTAADQAYRQPPLRGIAPLADVYLPKGEGPHPSVVLVHGGGFLIGSRRMKPMRYIAKQFVEAGFAVMVFDYRMIFRGGRMADCVDDVATAMSWWRGQVERYQLDSQRISMMGLSAGATLMLLAASRLPAGMVQRIVSVFGVYDFTYLNGRLAGVMRRWLFQSNDLAVWRRWSPVEATTADAEVLLIHGDRDDMVPIGHAARLAASRQAQGLPVSTVVIGGARHAFFNEARTVAQAERAMQAAIQFLKQPVSHAQMASATRAADI
jgi:acetyl esterase/lipase